MQSPFGLVGTTWPWRVFPSWISDNDLVEQAIKDVIFTTVGERKMSTEYGSGAMSFVFENKGPLLEALARRTISLALAQHLPVVRVLNIDVDEGEADTDPVTITVDYEYLGTAGNVAVEIPGQ